MRIKVRRAAQTADAFSNSMFRLGYGSQSPLEATQYPATHMTENYALLNSLYRESWLVQNVVEGPSLLRGEAREVL